jgi:hypothetical protein
VKRKPVLRLVPKNVKLDDAVLNRQDAESDVSHCLTLQFIQFIQFIRSHPFTSVHIRSHPFTSVHIRSLRLPICRVLWSIYSEACPEGYTQLDSVTNGPGRHCPEGAFLCHAAKIQMMRLASDWRWTKTILIPSSP